MKENEIKKEHPVADTVTLVLFFLILFGITLWGVLLPDRGFSENENRNLAQFPAWNTRDFFDGTWMSDFSKYLSDQVPLRDEMVTFHAAAERVLGKQENASVLAGSDGYLFEREDYPSVDRLQTNLSAIDTFAAYAESLGVPTCLAVAGRKIDVVTDCLPALYGTETQELLWSEIDTRAAALPHVSYRNLRDVLLADGSGEQLYYRTDHHWTAKGALLAYRALGDLGLTVREESFFTEELVSTDFFGTTWSNSGMTWIAPDEMSFLRWEGDEQVKTYAGMHVLNGFYVRSKLAEKDKYAAFFGAQYGYMEIRGDESADREKLLVIKDSFAHAVLPMLAADYDIDVLDLRYYTYTKGMPSEILAQGGYDGVLILCSTPLLTDASTKESGKLPFEELAAGLT